MKNIYTLLFVLSVCSFSFAQQTSFSRIKINLEQTSIAELARLGLEIDHGEHAHGRHLINDFSADEIALLDTRGIDYKVLIRDVQAWYQEGNETGIAYHPEVKGGFCDDGGPAPASPYPTPENYEYGSMGGYLTLTQAYAELDKMANLFPNLLQARMPIAAIKTHEDRDIFWLRISDNPQQDEAEPEILYTALHHAREPNSLSQMIYYMWYLLENYETNAEVKYLVDNTEMYFIPVVNPDGYAYNESISPSGGGLWRKNRWVNPDTGETDGVDLNRNYGHEWAFDDQGSSPNPGSQTFRGPAAFSEPETQAVKALCDEHEFQIALNYHTYGNLLIQPWGYSDSPSPDDATFDALSEIMTKENDFFAGTGSETVGYTVNGDSDDWMYGEEGTKPKIFAMTPEVGQGFWPNEASIDPFNKTCMLQNLAAAHLLLNYAELVDEGEENFSEAASTFSLGVKKYGLLSGANTLSISPVSGNFSITSPAQASISLDHLQEALFAVDYQLSSTDEPIQELVFEVTIDNGQYSYSQTIKKTVILGESEPLFVDNADELNNWLSSNGDWGVTGEDYYSSPTSITDSPESNYSDDVQSLLSLREEIVLPPDALAAHLQFRGKWDIENAYDYVQLSVELTDYGTTFPLCGKYTNPGSGNQLEGQPLYDGTQSEWVLEYIDLTDYLGQTVKFHFSFWSDGYLNFDGFYFDDFEVIVTNPLAVSTEEPAVQAVSFRAYPNPMYDQINVHFYLNQSSDVQIELINQLGQVIASQENKALSSGTQQINWALPGITPGIYTLELKTVQGDRLVKKIVKQE